jgi:hypothetical protein
MLVFISASQKLALFFQVAPIQPISDFELRISDTSGINFRAEPGDWLCFFSLGFHRHRFTPINTGIHSHLTFALSLLPYSFH